MKNLKASKYKILIMIVVVIIGIIGINKIGRIDKNAGKIEIEKAYVSRVIGNISEANVVNNEKIRSYDKIEYEIKYKIDGEEKRNVEIKASLTEEEARYALFEEISDENKTSILNKDNSGITIKIEEVEPNKEQKLKLKLIVKDAPDGYKVAPRVEIKEETNEKYVRINIKEAIVETKSVTGVIRDETKNGVQNVELKIENENGEEVRRTYTDVDGKYTFSDLEEGKYYINVVEDRFEIVSQNEIEIKTGEVLDIDIKEVEPFKINIKKYIKSVTINGKTYTYGEMEKVNQSVKNLKTISGEIEYKVVAKNEGKKEGVITRVEEEIGEGLSFKNNNGWVQKNNKIRNEEVEGISLKPGEEKEIKLVLQIDKTNEAKRYLSKVTAKGEIYEKISYIVDNEVYKEEEVLEGEKVTEISMPDENGVKFSGWYTDKNYTNKYNFNSEVTKDLILYGKYEEKIKKYNVIFIDEGKIVKKEELEEGSIIASPLNPSKEGYTFKGWYEEEGKDSYDLLEPVARDITLYSKYDINKYKIIFKNDDGTILQDDMFNYGQIPEYIKAQPTKKETDEYRYIFSGWNPKIEKVTKNQTYTAVYEKEKKKYTITFIDKGISTSQTLDYGSVVTKPVNPTEEGYTFKGWYEDGKDSLIEFPIILTRNIILNSEYEINKYTVKFFDKDYEIKEFEQIIEYNEKAKEPELAPTMEDYDFAGWFIRGTDTPYVFGTPVKENIELESKFTKKNTYTVTFDIDGDTSILSPQTIIDGKTVSKPDPEPVKKGYIFDGWYIDNTYSDKYNFDTKITEDKIIYGRYIENAHKVTYINDGELYEEEKVLDKYPAFGPKKGNPEKIGHTFLYWSLKENGDKYLFDETEITEDITLYSVYEKNSYQVVFKNDDGTILQSESLKYGSIPEYKGVTPLKEKTDEYTYTFKEWSPNITIVEGNQEYVANYAAIKNQYQITFVNYNGEELQSESLEYGSMPEYKGETPLRKSTNEYTYTFKGWNPEVTSVVSNQVYKAEYIETKNQYTVTFMDNNNVYGSKKVNYGETITKIEPNPIKEYNIFKTWVKEDGSVYDFSTPIVNDITLYSNYELVESPTIEHTPINWTNDKVIVTINSNHDDYTYKYKLEGEENYHDYIGAFEVSENKTVIAKSIKENIESELSLHEIANIDKINPEIKEINEGVVTSSSIEIITKIRDKESGLKEVKIYNNEELVGTYPYNENTIEEETITHTINNLEELTTYKIKIEAIDYAGNISISDEKEVSTIEKDVVAKIIGRNNKLNKDLIKEAKEEIGENITEEEIKEIEERYSDERYESLEDAINACNDSQCTIEMVKSTQESVEILDTQDITIDINGKTITGVRDYTILNNGILIIKDSFETSGSIYNPNDIAIKNIEGATLTLGVDEEPQEVSTEKPNIVGQNTGIQTKGILNFYDGRVEGTIQGISGKVTKTPYLYNPRVISGNTEVVTLTILAEAEARVNSTYYPKIVNAINDTKNGYYETHINNRNILSYIQSIEGYPGYSFVYDEESNTLKSTNQGIPNKNAQGYIEIDLTEYENDQLLTVNAEISSEERNDLGYALITETPNVPSSYIDETGVIKYISGEVEAKDYILKLSKGKKYYLHFGYIKNGSIDSGLDTFTINKVSLKENEKDEVTTFEEKTEVPILNEEADTVEMLRTITLSNPLEIEDTKNVILDLNGQTLTTQTNDYVIKNNGNLKIIDSKYTNDIDNIQINYENELAQNKLEYERALEKYNEYKNKKQIEYDTTYISEIEMAKQGYTTDDYVKDNLVLHLDGIEHGEEENTWKDLSGNENNGTIYGATWSNDNGLKFDGVDDYVSINQNNYNFDDDTATVEVIFSTTSTNNQLFYLGTDDKIAIGQYNGYILVATPNKNQSYTLPSDFTDGNKKKVTVVRIGNDYKLYYNGKKQTKNSYEDYYARPDTPTLGGRTVSNRYMLNGKIYSARVYNKALTEEEIKQNYNIDSIRYSYYPTSNELSSDSDKITQQGGILVEEANAELTTFGGRSYYKTTNEPARAAYYSDGGGTYVILVGETPNSVSYNVWGRTFTYSSTYEFRGKIYYISSSEYALPGNYTSTSGVVPKLSSTDRNSAIRELLGIAQLSSENAYNAFDKDKTTSYETDNNDGYIYWNLSEDKTITSFKLYGSDDVSKNPKTIELLGSKDKENYITLSNTIIDTIPDDGLKIEIEKEKWDSYISYKWQFTGEDNSIKISEIEPEVYGIIHKKYDDTIEKFDTNVDNFEYSNSKNETRYSYMKNNNSALKFTSAYSENNGMIVLKKKIVVNEDSTYTMQGNLGLWQDFNDNELLGKVYIGFSKTKEISKDDFENYITYNITSNKEEYRDFKVTAYEPGEYYFKIILYHTDITPDNTVHANLYSLNLAAIPEEKQAYLKSAVQQGNITSTTGNIILNEEGANLVLNDAIINVRKPGTSYSSFTYGITNYGTLTLKDNAIINNSENYAIAIENKKIGKILNASGTINITGNPGSYGLRNYSTIQDEISGMNISIANNSAYGILQYANHDLTIDNVNIEGNGRAIYIESPSILTMNNNNINAFIGVEISNEATLNIKGGNINSDDGIRLSDSSSGTININDGTISTLHNTIYAYNQNKIAININGGEIIAGYRVINNTYGNINDLINITGGNIRSDSRDISMQSFGTFNMTGGNIETTGTIISLKGPSSSITGGKIYHKSGWVIENYSYGTLNIGENFEIDDRSSGSGISNQRTGIVNITDNIVISGSNDIGIYNNGGGVVNISDNVIVKGNNYGINNTNGTINIGTKDSDISTAYPKIDSKKYAINNTSTLNYYDGVLIGEKDISINGYISESYDNYDLNIKEESDTLENITLAIPTKEEFGEVARIDEETYPSITEAINALKDNEEKTIYLLKPIRTIIKSNIKENKKAILELDGNQLKMVKFDSLLENNGELKVTDRTAVKQDDETYVEGSGVIAVASSKDVIANFNILEINANVTGNTKSIRNSQNSSLSINHGNITGQITNENDANMEINNGNITNGTTIISNTSTNKVVINGGSIHTTGTNSIDTYGPLEINGGTITTGYSTNNGRTGIIVRQTGSLLMTEGTISGAGWCNNNIQNLGTSTIKGGTLNSGGCGSVINNTGTFTIENVTINGDNESITNANVLNIYNGKITGNIVNSGVSIITGGNITRTNNSDSTIINTGEVTITGGEITSKSGYAINNSNILTLGTKGDTKEDGSLNVSKESPIIKSTGNIGVSSVGTFNFYDGIIKGTSAISGVVSELEEGYEIIQESASQTEDKLEAKYLDRLPIVKLLSNNKEYYTMQEAITDAEEKDTLEVLRNVTMISTADTITVPEDKNIILDLKGYKIIGGNNIVFNNLGTLRIIDSKVTLNEDGSLPDNAGSITSLQENVITNSGTLEIEKVSLSTSALKSAVENSGTLTLISSKISSSYIGIKNIENGFLTIEDGNVIVNNNRGYDVPSAILNESVNKVILKNTNVSSSCWYNYNYCANHGILNNSGEIEINGGTISSSRYGRAILSNQGKVTLNGGTISDIWDSMEIENKTSSTLIINSGTITGGIINSGDLIVNDVNINPSNEQGSSIENSNNATINGGTITCNNSYSYSINNTGTLNITGGNIKQNSSGKAINNTGTIEITGGEIISNGVAINNSNILTLGTKGDTKEDGSLNVSKESPIIKSTGNIGVSSAGTFNFYDGIIKGTTAISGSISDVEEGYEIIQKTEDNLEAKYLDKLPVAQIENQSFYTIEEAIEKCTNSNQCEIDIVRNITFVQNANTIIVPEGKNIILDLNGYKITGGNNIVFNNLGTLRIIDSKVTLNEDGLLPDNVGSITSLQENVITNSGTLEIEKVSLSTLALKSTIENSGTLELVSSKISSRYIGIMNNDNASTQMNSGSINVSGDSHDYIYGIKNNSNNKVTINGGTISVYQNAGYPVAIDSNNGQIEINGGIISSNSYGIRNTELSTLKISNGEINGPRGVFNSGILIVDGGNIYGTAYVYTIENTNNATINGGTISSNSSGGKAIYNSGTLNITNGNILNNNGTQAIYNDASGNMIITGGNINNQNGEIALSSNGTIDITGGEITSNEVAIENGNGIMNISGGIINTTSTNSNLINQTGTGTLNLSNIELSSTNSTIQNSGQGIVNIPESVTIISSNIGVKNTGIGTINIGEKDRKVSTKNPIIQGNNYGIYNENTNGIINLYDGIITGAENQSIYGTIDDIEFGYKIKSDTIDGRTSSVLAVVGVEESVAVVNGMNFLNLQSAVNAASDNIETNIVLYKDITLSKNINVSNQKNIKLYLNGHTINYNGYGFTGEGIIDIIEEGIPSNFIRSVASLIRDVLDISDISKSVVIYEMDDGSNLESNKTYKLYKDNKEQKVEEGEVLGRYSIGKIEEEMRTVRGRLYLNNLSVGDYEIISNDGKRVTFNITDEGKIYGTAKENIVKENKGLVVTAIAELIISIQTGVIQGRYILLLSLVVIILSLLVIVQKRKRDYYGNKL